MIVKKFVEITSTWIFKTSPKFFAPV